ncbi:glycosyltransferase family 2 protein [Desertibacillus haloalkaliphilus]|uniref:glycosyltransferase family 2 protein n=1 Tax=Desertibacillus haloalkaliphilus TaxID=1328930 RepID=UPI001C2741AE|nr:glycosyltransferase family 2 protein [Desertibacillus haloalkaliphilus]MBU8906549.1 glycosyltransferase family 2 protein [Desertibacillus haloalkaliphilus]
MVYLSIIIPHYNSPRSLKKLLDSIPQKEEIQIIVIDDRSNLEVDKLYSLISNNKYNHVLFTNNNTDQKGAGVCRNIGLDIAEGKWILFADSDDFFTDGFYDTVSSYFSTDNDIVFFSPTSVEVDTGNKSDRHVQKEKIITSFLEQGDYKSEVSLRYRFFVPWSKLIRSDFIKDNKIYFDEVIASNDVMFSVKAGYYMKKFEVSRDIIYCVTKSRGTLTTNTSLEVYDSRLRVYINYCQFLKANLNKEELEMFNLRGSTMIINAVKYRLGFRKIFSIYVTLKNNNIEVFDLRFFNPVFLIKKSIYHYRNHKKQKKYLVK